MTSVSCTGFIYIRISCQNHTKLCMWFLVILTKVCFQNGNYWCSRIWHITEIDVSALIIQELPWSYQSTCYLAYDIALYVLYIFWFLFHFILSRDMSCDFVDCFRFIHGLICLAFFKIVLMFPIEMSPVFE